MSVWMAWPKSTPRHGEANINVHVLCHRDFIRCFLCNCISRTTVMKMPQRANGMNCETSPLRRPWPPLGRGDPAPAPSKVLGDLLGINDGLFARVLALYPSPRRQGELRAGPGAGLPMASAGSQDWLLLCSKGALIPPWNPRGRQQSGGRG